MVVQGAGRIARTYVTGPVKVGVERVEPPSSPKVLGLDGRMHTAVGVVTTTGLAEVLRVFH